MSFFVDANIILYATDPVGEKGERCRQVIDEIATGTLDGRSSAGVIEEVLHVELRERSGVLTGVAGVAYSILTPLLPVTDEVVRLALDLRVPGLGSNDRVHLAVCLTNGIGTIFTGDEGFEGIDGLHRVDPLDEDALDRLRTASAG